MMMKKKVHSKAVKKGGFFQAALNMCHSSTDFFKTQRTDLMQSFKFAKTSTKVVIISIVVAALLFGTITAAGSVNDISKKERILAELDQQIAAQEAENQSIQDQLTGNFDDYIESEARERLEMVYPDEQVYINIAG